MCNWFLGFKSCYLLHHLYNQNCYAIKIIFFYNLCMYFICIQRFCSKQFFFFNNKYVFEVWSCVFYTETLLHIRREVMTSLIMYERENFRSYIVCNINQCHLLGEYYLTSFIMYNTVWHQLWCTRWHLFHMIQEWCHKIRQMREGINQHCIPLLLSGSIKQQWECKIWLDSLSLPTS